MLCLTGNESSVAQLARRLERYADDGDLLHEVRLDALQEPVDGVFGLLERFGSRSIVCCRPEREGGHYVGAEQEGGGSGHQQEGATHRGSNRETGRRPVGCGFGAAHPTPPQVLLSRVL